MDRYIETINSWNKIADLYQDKFMDLTIYNESYDLLCAEVSKNSPEVLEIGCGPGNITKYILSKRPDFNILGIDAAANMIELAKRNNPEAHFVELDCRNINELQQRFDAIVCGFCLPYLALADGVNLIVNSYHLLHDNGIIYISFVEGDPDKSGYQVGESGDRIYFHFYPLNDIVALLKGNGFDTIKLLTVDYQRSTSDLEKHTILLAKKNINGKNANDIYRIFGL